MKTSEINKLLKEESVDFYRNKWYSYIKCDNQDKVYVDMDVSTKKVIDGINLIKRWAYDYAKFK